MKIAMIGQKGIPAQYGGIERHVEDLATQLTTQGHEVLVYSRKWYSPMSGRYKGIKVVTTPTIHSKHLDAIIHTFTSTIHAIFQKADIIHYHGVGPALLAWLPRIFARSTRVVVTFHCIDRYHQKWNWFARLMLRLGEKAACVFPHETISVSKTIHKYCLNEHQTNTTLLPNGVMTPPPTSANLLSRWKLLPGKYLLMVSRLVPHKGAHYLLEAWQFAKKQYPELLREYKLVIVGGSAFTDEYVEELHSIAGNDTSIIFTDWLSGEPLEQLYANAGLFVHPSENEGLPLTVLQAMSYGRPVLVSNIPEHQEIITDPRYWFTNTSIRSLADKIIELLKEPKLLKEAGNSNSLRVAEFYDWQVISQKTETVYRDSKHKISKISKLEIA